MGSRHLKIPEWVDFDGEDESIESQLFGDGDLFLIAVAIHSTKSGTWRWDIHTIISSADDNGVSFYHVAGEAFEDVERIPWEYSWGDVQYFMRLN